MGEKQVQKPLLPEIDVSAIGLFAPFLSAGVIAWQVPCVPREKCSLDVVIFAMPACDRENHIKF